MLFKKNTGKLKKYDSSSKQGQPKGPWRTKIDVNYSI